MMNGSKILVQFKDVSDIPIRTLFTFTINPTDKVQFWDTKLNRVEKVCLHVTTLLKTLPAWYTLFPEVSRQGRIHFHGTIRFNNIEEISEFFIYNVHGLNTWAQIEIDTIADPKEWSKYIMKQQGNIIPVDNKFYPINHTSYERLTQKGTPDLSKYYAQELAPEALDG